MKKTLLFILASLSLVSLSLASLSANLMLPQPAFAARAPDAVECTIEFQGLASRDFAALLGLSQKHPEIVLTLSEGTSWAVYLLKKDTPTPLYNMDGQPRRRNKIRFVEGPQPHLSIGPFFQDLGTALPYSKPGNYSFSTETVDDSLRGSETTSKLLRDWKAMSGWKNPPQKSPGKEIFRRSFLAKDGTEAEVQVFSTQTYPNNVPTWGYLISLSLRPAKEGACRR